MPRTPLDLKALAAPFRYRVRRDAEGWPVIPGRLGQIEPHDDQWLAVYSNRPRVFARLWCVPGVRRWQIGDQEVRALVPLEQLSEVAGLIQARRRRPATSAACLQKARTPTYSVTSAG
jgi:hypothetical protein